MSISADSEDLLKLVRVMVSGFQELSVELKQLHLKTSQLEEKVSLLYDRERQFSSGRATSLGPDDPKSSLQAADLSQVKRPKTAETSCSSILSEKPRESEDMISGRVQISGQPADHRIKEHEQVLENHISHQQAPGSPGNAGIHGDSPPILPKQGLARCPFAAAGPMNQLPSTASTLLTHPEPSVDDLKGNDNHTASNPTSDPIEIEIRGRRPSSAARSAAKSGHKCPIRFLSHHSAEEVAQYFERHKHEIPRSHEICVRRHQDNEETIRQLDAKYGNLVTMIQDLGLKHQPLLPSKSDDELEEGEKNANRSVEEWAGEVGQAYQESNTEEPLDNRGREMHSDHPLKEVRLGESPSRPWGISIPVDERLSGNINSNEHSPRDEKHAPVDTDGLGRSPLPSSRIGKHSSGAALERGSPRDFVIRSEKDARPNPGAARVLHGPRAQMTFTGPVFIGYQLEDAVTLLKHSSADL